MALAAGTRLGPYEVVAALGAGGMGEVYQARDTRLDRTVAIKVLPAELSTDPERRARFEREARTIAALNHPHICTLFDVGEHDGTTYLVMEHLAGETLADRLRRGPLPIVQALEFGAQIADALDAAHKRGIIHRDLKPGNVMLTTSGTGRSGTVSARLLDFGLAKLARQGERPALVSETHAVTEAAPVTARGTILGTLHYMAPEQLQGKEADARTDLWALGAILYEMLTGKRAFAGDSGVSLIGNIMNGEPAALATGQPLSPPSLERVVKKCLAKHPDDRWDTAHDVADELRWISQTSGAAALAEVRHRRTGGGWIAGAVAGALLMFAVGAAVMWLLRPAAPSTSSARVSLDVRPAEELNAGGVQSAFLATPGGSRTALTWTPDGQALVFVGRLGGVQQLFVRRLDAAQARPLAGTEGAQVPAVSTDGLWVAFWAQGAIRKVPLAGGPPMDLAAGIASPPWGMVWDAGGRVFFSRSDGRIWQVRPDGSPEAVTTVGEAEVRHVLPHSLPPGRVLLYTVRKRERSWGDEEIVAHTLATGARKVLLRDAADARYLPTGYLVFLRRGTLLAVRFDAKRLEVQGSAVAVADAVVQALTGSHASNVTGAGQFAIAPTGTLAWIQGPITPYPDSALVTVDRQGRITVLPVPVRSYTPFVSCSPDGRQLAASIYGLTEVGLWLSDLDRGTLTLVNREGEARYVKWSPREGRLMFSWLKDGRESLAAQPADGTASPQVVLAGGFVPSSWTPDGQQLVGVQSGDIAITWVEGGKARAKPLFKTPHRERWPELSPDGRWLVYGSDVSGRDEVYVRPFPGSGPAEQLSVDGGNTPAWRSDGREMYFISPLSPAGRRSMMVADVDATASHRIGRPRPLFEFDPAELFLLCSPVRCYDIAPNGQRFFGVQLRPGPPPPPVTHINLIQNWFEELKAKVPSGTR